MSRADRFYILVIAVLVVAAVTGAIRLAVQHSTSQPLEIRLSETEPSALTGQLHIGGAVANPGTYPWQEDDTIQALLLDAGIEPHADLSHIKLYVPGEDEAELPQKIDINRAEAWLLQALPGIGEAKAQAIVAYRQEHGPFRSIEDLVKVSGIGPATLEKISDCITVSD